MKLRITACLLLLAMTFAALSASLPALAEDTDGTESSSAVSSVRDISTGVELRGFTGHGQNQTRLLETSSGIYMTNLGDADSTGTSLGGLWKVEPDGTNRVLYTFPVYGVAAGGTCQAMADNDGNVWVIHTSDKGSGLYRLHAYCYDPKTDITTEYLENKGYYRRGGNFGKPGAVMDPVMNRIYVMAGGGDKKGYLTWTYFDLTTRTWEKDMKVAKVKGPYFYQYMYPDGKGGLISTCESCYVINDVMTDIEGMKVPEAIAAYRSNKGQPQYLWLEPTMLYIPDVTEETVYEIPLEDAKFDVKNGCYPHVWNANNDLYWDKTNNLLYAISTLEENGVPEQRTMLYIYDTSKVNDDILADGVFKCLAVRTLTFIDGAAEKYSQHIYQDTTGRLWILAYSPLRGAVEIWLADDPLFESYRLVDFQVYQGALDLNNGDSSTVIATNRNNSVMDDTATVGISIWRWYLQTIDFAALRAKLGLK